MKFERLNNEKQYNKYVYKSDFYFIKHFFNK